jgi:hypothetical protein
MQPQPARWSTGQAALRAAAARSTSAASMNSRRSRAIHDTPTSRTPAARATAMMRCG